MSKKTVDTAAAGEPPVQADGQLSESTRVFVSGLPPKLNSEQLATHFREKFSVTDAHVIPDRRIGFVGFADASSAKTAVKYYNRSFIRMSKISVDLARPVELKQNAAGHSIPVSKRNGSDRLSQPVFVPEVRKRKRADKDEGEELREGKALRSENLNQQVQAENSAQLLDSTESRGESIEKTDNDWLRGKTSRLLDLVDPEEHTNHSRTVEQPTDVEETSFAEEPADTDDDEPYTDPSREVNSVPNARLFVRNLPFTISETEIQNRFGKFGKVQEVHIVKDNRTSTGKGMAFVQFAEPHQAQDALQALDGVAFHGRLLHILPASDKRDQGLTDFDISKMPLKKQKAIRRRMEAGSATFSWNSLYMNPDAVLSSVADRLGVSKSEILDPTSADAAVKQAHAETQLIKETKDYLKSCGVHIEAFKSQSRNDRSLLLKNFPFGTSETELKEMLEPFGKISRLILPPSGTMAIAQFEDSYSTSQALRDLAYKNIKGSVLYLEKAPQGLLDGVGKPLDETKPIKLQVENNEIVDSDQVSKGPTATAFVRNLNFSTSSANLTNAFSALPGFLSARVKTRTDAKRPGEILSMGFGFVEFKTKEQADTGVAAMNKYRLDGHELLVQLSNKSLDLGEERRRNDVAKKNEANKTKIIIKNLPFQTSRKDVRSLFTPYGQLKTIRVPRKFDNTARGFAFAEFITTKEAESAMEALANTHLLGRRLVLEFAQGDAVDPEEEIRAIEKKVEQQSNRVQMSRLSGPGRKKFNVETARNDAEV